MPGLTKRMTLEAWRHLNVSNEDLLEAIDKVGNAAAAVRKELQGKGLAMPDNDKPLKPEDFPVNAEGKKIKKEDGTPIAQTPDPAVATDVANRPQRGGSAPRRRQVVGLRSCGGCHVEALLPRIVSHHILQDFKKSRPLCRCAEPLYECSIVPVTAFGEPLMSGRCGRRSQAPG
jgi:hypothetical protein